MTLYLSVVLAVFNEERQLASCLASVADLADEIIVVDGESIDGTAEIARKAGARVITTTNKRNFHINKQMAVDAAHGKLILQLDADETLDTELHSFVAELKSKLTDGEGTPTTGPVAWYLKRKNHLFGRWLSKGGQYPDPVIRLFYAGTAKFPLESVHEQIAITGQVDTAPGHLLHIAYPTFEDYLRKFNTYTSFEAHRLLEKHPLADAQAVSALDYCLIKPVRTFFSLYARHRGYVDGMAGFIFALMSAWHHPFVYIKYKELAHQSSETVETD